MASHRYLLPAQIFLIVISAHSAGWLWKRPAIGSIRVFRYLVILLLLAHGLSVALSFPRHISYFNDAVPNSRRMHLLADYDFDIGQDFKRLARTAERLGWKHIKLATESMTDPSIYGIHWKPWSKRDLDGPQPGWTYVTSVAFLQAAPFYYPQTYPIAMSWVRRLPPTMMVGDTLLIHEIPGTIVSPDNSPSLDSVPYFRMDPQSAVSIKHHGSSLRERR
jgi:hypothetical protein